MAAAVVSVSPKTATIIATYITAPSEEILHVSYIASVHKLKEHFHGSCYPHRCTNIPLPEGGQNCGCVSPHMHLLILVHDKQSAAAAEESTILNFNEPSEMEKSADIFRQFYNGKEFKDVRKQFNRYGSSVHPDWLLRHLYTDEDDVLEALTICEGRRTDKEDHFKPEQKLSIDFIGDTPRQKCCRIYARDRDLDSMFDVVVADY